MRTSIFVTALIGVILFSCNDHSRGRPSPVTVKLTKQIDSIVILKSQRMMNVYDDGKLLKTYRICLGPTPIGPKHFKGDGKTPEGMYHINGKNPNSSYHKCLGVSYPDDRDRLYAQKAGKPTGGDIKIHGLPNGKGYLEKAFVKVDWTAGCIALTDTEIDELYAHVNVGAYINILP